VFFLKEAAKNGLITKATSWYCKAPIPAQKDVVKKYINLNKESLPKIAVREVKLRSGKKTKSKSPKP
jgi:hypothetical protein